MNQSRTQPKDDGAAADRLQTRGARPDVAADTQTASANPGVSEPTELGVDDIDNAFALDWRGKLMRRLMTQGAALFSKYVRLEIERPEEFPPPPALIVANHGFGGVVDPNGSVVTHVLNQVLGDPDTPFVFLMHEAAWKVGVGPLFEPAGFRPAGRRPAMEGLAHGGYVFVMPGGDIEASKPFRDRNKIVFGGRTGFGKLAIEAGVPIIPLVVSGAGETVLVLSNGERVAKALRLPQLARQKAIPISVALPWGINVGVAGAIGYLPLPAKMRAAVLPAMEPLDGESGDEFATRVEAAMQAKLTEMTEGRIPLIGTRMPKVNLTLPALPWRSQQANAAVDASQTAPGSDVTSSDQERPK